MQEGISQDGYMSREELAQSWENQMIRLKIINLITNASVSMDNRDVELLKMYFNNWIDSYNV